MEKKSNKCLMADLLENVKVQAEMNRKKEVFKESIQILRGIDNQVADIFENIVMNADYYNRKGK